MLLTRHPRHHGYQIDGVDVPSVSAVLKATGQIKDFDGIDPVVLEKARERGIRVHAICEALDKGESPGEVAEEHKPYMNAYARFIYDSELEVIQTEEAIHHPHLLYAGTPDLIGRLNGVGVVVDRKATYDINHTAVSLQTAAYRGAWNALNPVNPVAQIYSLHLRRDGTYRLHRYDADEAWSMWMAALALYRYGRKTKA